MNLYLKIFILCSSLALMIIVLNALRKKRISTKISILWITAVLFIFLCALFSSPLFVLSELVGFEAPVNMIFFLGFLFLLVICFYLCIVISKLQGEITLLTQVISLQAKRVEDEFNKRSQ